MPWGLTRFHQSGQSYFVTIFVTAAPFYSFAPLVCSAQRRLRLLTHDESRRIFESGLERMRRSCVLHVVMPEHVELLLSEPQYDTSSNRTAPLKPTPGLNGPPMYL